MLSKFKIDSKISNAINEGKATFRLRNVYQRLHSVQAPGCLSTSSPTQKNAVYAVIKGLLVLFHSDVDSRVCRSSPKKQAAADALYVAFCSHGMRPLALDELRYKDTVSVELLALAVRRQIVADRMDRDRHVPR